MITGNLLRNAEDGINIVQQIEQNSIECPDKISLIDDAGSWTYQQLHKKIQWAANLLHSLGIQTGEQVALCLPNCSEFVFSYFGGLYIGAVVIPINPELSGEEIKSILTDSLPKVVITNQNLANKIFNTGLLQPEQVIVIKNYDCTNKSEVVLPVALLLKDSPSLILYSSGTTGKSKGVVLSHQNVITVTQQTIPIFGLQAEDKVLHFMPLSHSFGQTAVLCPTLYAGATLVLLPGFEAKMVAQTVEMYQITTFFGVPTIYTVLKELATPKQMQSVRRYYSGAATLSHEISRQWFEKYGVPIHEKYGSTETSLICFNHDPLSKAGSVGLPLAGVNVKLLDEAGTEIASGEIGEIAVHSPGIMLGYWNQPEETARAIRDGWFYTGDIGRMDKDGYLTIVDRKKDMINVGGQKVYPSEVEQVLYRHPAVTEAAVYGAPEPILGEQVRASIILKQGQTVTSDDIIRFCRKSLADYKLPGVIEFVETLPKGKTGKVLKRLLREEADTIAPQTTTPAIVPKSQEITIWLQQWLAHHLMVKGINWDRPFSDYGLTSILAVRLVTALNQWLGSSLSAIVVWNYPTINTLANYIAQDETTNHKRQIEFWPTIDAYLVFDALMYDRMLHDTERERAFRSAIEQTVADKLVLDIRPWPNR